MPFWIRRVRFRRPRPMFLQGTHTVAPPTNNPFFFSTFILGRRHS